jgi:hypothetical protein
VKVRIPPKHVAEGLVGDDYSGEQHPTRDFLVKLAYEIEDESGNIREEPSVMAQENSQSLRKSKNELTVGQIKQHLLGELFGE